ncbi:MAG: hypothetical protein ACYC7H_12890, partial [Chloroflexota bacterium]
RTARSGEMYRLLLADLRRAGWLDKSYGVREWFVPIAKMEPTPWRAWPFAERVIHLENEPETEPAETVRQLGLFGGAA